MKNNSTKKDALKVARYIGCSGAHQNEKGQWLPCSSPEKLAEISQQAESSKYKPERKAEDRKPKKVNKRRYVVRGFEQLGERGVLGIDTLPGGGLVSGKSSELEEYELLDLKEGNYTKPRLRESIKKRIMAGSRGGKPGEWSARKAQLLAIEYRRAGGGYRGGKKKPQRSLDKWTSEEWTTSDGKPAIRDSGTNRYLPKKAWGKLTPAQREATNRKKRNASRQGRQFVANTERAREAGARVRNSEKSMIIGRARPRRGDPDVYDDPDAARLRSRALGCIGIARRETQNGEVVWTPCTNVSDFRRRTGQSVLGQRDEMRRFRRRLRQVGGPAYDRRNQKSDLSNDVEGKNLSSIMDMPTIGRRFGAIRPRSKRCKNINFRDGDGDGFICNPATGNDDLPLVGGNAKLRATYESIKQSANGWSNRWKSAHGGTQPNKVSTGQKEVDAVLNNFIKRGFIVRDTGSGYKIEVPPSFKRQFLAKIAATGEYVDPYKLGNLGYHKFHRGNDPNAPIREIVSNSLELFGYDPVNDQLYSPYFNYPKTYDQVKNYNSNEFINGLIKEGVNVKGAVPYLTDHPSPETVKPPLRGLESELEKNVLSMEEKRQELQYAKIKEFYSDLASLPPDRRIDDNQTLEVILDLSEKSFLGDEEIADVLNVDLTNLRKMMKDWGMESRESPVLKRIKEKEAAAKIPSKSSKPKVQEPFEFDRNRVGQTPTYDEYVQYLRFWAWRNSPGHSDKEVNQKIKNNPRLKEMLDIFDFSKEKKPSNQKAPFVWKFFSDNYLALRAGGKLPMEYGLTTRGSEMRQIINILTSTRDANRALAELRKSDMLKTWNRLYASGLVPDIKDFYRRFNELPQPGATRMPERKVRGQVKSLQPITHITPFSFKTATENILISIDPETIADLENQVYEHNQKMASLKKPTWSIANISQLVSVYERGLASCKNLDLNDLVVQKFANERVKAFLQILKSGTPANKKYFADNDLLHKDNPWARRTIREKTSFIGDEFEVKSTLRTIGQMVTPSSRRRGRGLEGRGFRRGANRRFAAFDRFAVDADGDGLVQEGTTQERPAMVRAESKIAQLFERLKEPEGGFTYSVNKFDDIKAGWAIARKGSGVRMKVSDVFNNDGSVTDDALDRLEALLEMNEQELTGKATPDGRQVALGGWHNPEDGYIYFDITDVHNKNAVDKDAAMAEGNKQNQISIVDLNALHEAIGDGNWDREIFFSTGGDGENLLDEGEGAKGTLGRRYAKILQEKRKLSRQRRGEPTPEERFGKKISEDRQKRIEVLKLLNGLSGETEVSPERFNAILDIIESRGDQDLDKLTKAFSKVYDEYYGEDIGEFIRRANLERGAQIQPGLVDPEFTDILKEFTVGGSDPINTYLRGGENGREALLNWYKDFDDKEARDWILEDLGIEDHEDEDSLVEGIEKAIETLSNFNKNGMVLPKEFKSIYRGDYFGNSESAYDDLEPGVIFTDRGFPSMTYSIHQALANGSLSRTVDNRRGYDLLNPTTATGQRVLFDFRIPDSVRSAHPVAPGLADESEWVLPKNGQFQVRTVTILKTKNFDGDPISLKRIVVDWIGVEDE